MTFRLLFVYYRSRDQFRQISLAKKEPTYGRQENKPEIHLYLIIFCLICLKKVSETNEKKYIFFKNQSCFINVKVTRKTFLQNYF